jgi:hypothetical protein
VYKEDKDFEREEAGSSSDCTVLMGWDGGEGLLRDLMREAVISPCSSPLSAIRNCHREE